MRVLNIVRQNKKTLLYIFGAIALAVIGLLVFGGDDTSSDSITVTRSDFVNQVSVSGKVETGSEAVLGFASSGRIGRINVKDNQAVREGQVLAQLEISDLLAELKIKEINLRTSDVEIEEARENLEKVTLQEDTKVESAYNKLLSGGLELVPNSTNYTVETPDITGLYKGQEGQYKIRITRENITANDFYILTFGPENTKKLINDEGPTPLGTKGLYISFPDDLADYEDTSWYLDIPNKASADYLANSNAYNEAKKARDLAIRSAEFELQKLLTEKNSGSSSVAQAEVDKIRSDIRKSTIYAPFSGVVTNIEKEVGETISSNETLLTVINEDSFEIESFVPEVNMALVEVGQPASVTLDAYGEEAVFAAKVVSIDPSETMRDGVATYKVKLKFEEDDPRIRSGMTANVNIVIFERPDTIVVPGGVVYERDGRHYVEVKTEKGIQEREVTLGESSTLGQVEIIFGLEAGEEVVLMPSRAE